MGSSELQGGNMIYWPKLELLAEQPYTIVVDGAGDDTGEYDLTVKTCEPYCGASTCGEDTCGGSCGTCGPDELCAGGVYCRKKGSCQGRCYTRYAGADCQCDPGCDWAGDCCEDACEHCSDLCH